MIYGPIFSEFDLDRISRRKPLWLTQFVGARPTFRVFYQPAAHWLAASFAKAR
jgi:hypothetical protein